MRRDVPNELEERRIIRLLARGAEAIQPLHEDELAALLRHAALPAPRRARRGVSVSLRTAVAVAAAIALAVTLPLRQPEAQRPAPPTGLAAHPAEFPVGSALSLLLSHAIEQRA